MRDTNEGTLLTSLRRALGFSIAPVLFIAIVSQVDPFGIIRGQSAQASSLTKGRIAKAINPTLWTLSRFKSSPAPNILLGDSRMASLSAERVSEHTGKETRNLAYGGASMQEMFDSFWFATRYSKLQTVTFGITLDAYNDYNILRRTDAVESILKNRLLYFTNRNVLSATWANLKAGALGDTPTIDSVTIDREAFWRNILEEQNLTYSRWQDPAHYREEFKKIADWCKGNGVTLRIIRFPTHRDVVDIVQKNGLTQKSRDMSMELKALAPLIDFAFREDIQNSRAAFNDPVHFNQDVAALIIAEVWPM
ncbi:MAG: hypothetical protein IT353_24735 [Gemmatimonadaceae bacterium]|nr:hypothetical protein [Gemmatimonadaceae bacterium]